MPYKLDAYIAACKAKNKIAAKQAARDYVAKHPELSAKYERYTQSELFDEIVQLRARGEDTTPLDCWMYANYEPAAVSGGMNLG